MKELIRRLRWDLVGIAAALAVAAFMAVAPWAFVMSGDDEAWNAEEEITDLVLTDRAELERIASDCLSGSKTADEYKGVKVDGAYPGEHPIVQFYYSGSGLASSTSYYGFYYSEDDVPAAFQNAGVQLVPTSADEWTWEDGTDNGGLTKRITDCWFYYKAWF